jgi:hypothetical protein
VYAELQGQALAHGATNDRRARIEAQRRGSGDLLAKMASSLTRRWFTLRVPVVFSDRLISDRITSAGRPAKVVDVAQAMLAAGVRSPWFAATPAWPPKGSYVGWRIR